MFSQFEGAEMLAEQFNISRKEMDEFAVASHMKAAKATAAGHFKREIVPLQGETKDGTQVTHDTDEGESCPQHPLPSPPNLACSIGTTLICAHALPQRGAERKASVQTPAWQP